MNADQVATVSGSPRFRRNCDSDYLGDNSGSVHINSSVPGEVLAVVVAKFQSNAA